MNRTRLDAETVRDSVLLLSGRLDDTMYGPPVQHFIVKPGVHVTPDADYDAFDVDAPAARRRSVYSYIFRTRPDPLLQALDCPDASQSAPVRADFRRGTCRRSRSGTTSSRCGTPSTWPNSPRTNPNQQSVSSSAGFSAGRRPTRSGRSGLPTSAATAWRTCAGCCSTAANSCSSIEGRADDHDDAARSTGRLRRPGPRPPAGHRRRTPTRRIPGPSSTAACTTRRRSAGSCSCS